ncbi:DUF3054 domain-containing protein [Rhodococcus sp. D2-41]|uniref:DUF3054 domain-containing protein n=1 Tax=Speluncibacter jeojiensis TaxID=2710754 RepID=A0A9X4LZ64_9ACTN|nr:DUF3054 domain-containing protein [Rhodococcus sp. D2-41]MDG3010346.1 DUF3054 domain-containing protein [Rhodococcus sp. D2-41]MDG3014080.1 DUF3054 domain-containing protein [Corynebacteriales bacterium D3-21]
MKKFHPALAASVVADVVLILLFAALGRNSHDESEALAGLWHTAWPFLAGLAIGWVVVAGWRRPTALAPTGLAAWIGTVAGGMILRVVVGQGTAFSFIIVATCFVGLFLMGWRAVYLFVGRRVRDHRRRDEHRLSA